MKRSCRFIVLFLISARVLTVAAIAESVQAHRYSEVKVTLDEKFTLADAEAIKPAPGSKIEILEDGDVVKVQIPDEKVKQLLANSVNMKVERNFILLERTGKLAGTDDKIINAGSCSGPNYYDYNNNDYLIADNQYWWYSDIDLSYAPSSYTVTCVDVHYEIEPSWSYIDVGLTDYEELDSGNPFIYLLENYVWGGSGTIVGDETGITDFNGDQLNQAWFLLAYEYNADGTGYIDYWWIKVYYEEPGGYCSASGGCDEYISRVQVGSINNSSSCSGYADYTGISTTMQIGTGYSITVTNGNAVYPQDRCGIWVDWNQDEDFDDTGETITVSGSPGIGPYTATITPPASAVLGQTRMRVSIVYNQTPVPCGSTSYGEVEDYTINVTSPVTKIKLGGDILASWGAPLSGIKVSSSVGPNDVTDAAGYYEFEVSKPFSGYVSIENPPQYWLFSPSSYTFTNQNTDNLDVDFTGYYSGPTTITVRGYVKTASGAGIKGVLLQANTGQQVYSGSNGYYQLVVSQGSPVPSPWTGTITATKDYWVFSPPSMNYSEIIADINNANYAGTYAANPRPVISGYIKTAGGQPVANVLITADSMSDSSMTDANGYYELPVPDVLPMVPFPWDGNVVPFKTDWSFVPTSRSYNDLVSDISDQNYVAEYIGSGCDNGWIEKWVAVYNGDDSSVLTDKANDLGVDRFGNIFITGEKVSMGTGWDYSTVKYDPEGNLIWSASFDSLGGTGAHASALDIDSFGNVYVTGRAEANDVLVHHNNCVTLRYSSDSNIPNWTAVYDGPNHKTDDGVDIAVDSTRGVYVLCESDGGVTGYDIVVLKYLPESNEPLWISRYDGPDHLEDSPVKIRVDLDGYVYVIGRSQSESTEFDCVTIKYSPDGNELWARTYNGSAALDDGLSDLAIDASGNVYVAGFTQEENYGSSTIIKYDSNGTVLWVGKYGAISKWADASGGLALDERGHIYVFGSIESSSGYSDYLLMKYGVDNNEPVWISTFDGPEGVYDIGKAVTLDDFGNIYVAGTTNLNSVISPDSGDFLTLKYAPDSNQPVWSAIYKGPPGSVEGAFNIALDDSRNVIVSGYSHALITVKYFQCCKSGDINCDRAVDYDDLEYLCDEWLMRKIFMDIAPDNGDGFVDLQDYSVFADSWLAQTGQDNYNPLCDVVPEGGDGIIDEQDMNIFMEEWLKVGLYYLYADIAPVDNPDGIVNFLDFAVLCAEWLE